MIMVKKKNTLLLPFFPHFGHSEKGRWIKCKSALMRYTSTSPKNQSKYVPEVFPYVTKFPQSPYFILSGFAHTHLKTTLKMKKAVFCSTAAIAETALSMEFIEMQTNSLSFTFSWTEEMASTSWLTFLLNRLSCSKAVIRDPEWSGVEGHR